MSTGIDQARPHSAEPQMNRPTEVRYSGLAPYRSVSLPYSGRVTVMASRYTVTSHGR
jgi:hypothetical protein